MAWLGEPVVVVVLRAREREGVAAEQLAGGDRPLDLFNGGARVFWIGEVDAVVGEHGEHGVHLVRNRGDEVTEEVGGAPRRPLLMQFDEGKLRGAIDRHQQVEPALLGADLGDVDVEVADRIALELDAGGCVAIDRGKLRDTVALQTAAQRRARLVRNAGLQGVEAIIQWQ